MQKAKRENEVLHFLNHCSDNEKIEFYRFFFAMHAIVHEYLLESHRLTFLVDTNVIQDVLSSKTSKNRNTRLHATKALLCYLEDYALATIFLCVTPAVIYEINQQMPIKGADDYQQVMNIIDQVAIELGMQVHTTGFNSISELRNATKSIHSDSQKIKKAFLEVTSTKWKMNFESNNGGIKIPFAVAEESAPEIKLEYLSPFYVKFAMMSIIEKKMYEQNKNQSKARKMMNTEDNGLSKLFKVRKNSLMGVADIELLSIADLKAQSGSRSPVITSAITYDRALMMALADRLGTVQHGGKFESGKDDPSDATEMFVYQLKMSERRNKFYSERAKTIITSFQTFCDKFKEDLEE